MAFCGNCGSEQLNGEKFCVSCGKAMNKSEQVPVINEKPEPASAKSVRKLNKRTLIIAGAASMVVGLVLATILSPKSLSLIKAEAEDALMLPADFSVDLSDADEPRTIMDNLSWVVFSAGDDDCSEDGEILSLVQNQGKLLASTDLNGSSIYFNQDIVEFESNQIPNEVIALINKGYDNPGCDYDSDSVETTLSGLGTSKDRLDIGPESSAYFAEDSDWSSTKWDFLSNKGASVVIADGKYLVVVRVSAYSDALSTSQANSILADAVEKIYK